MKKNTGINATDESMTSFFCHTQNITTIQLMPLNSQAVHVWCLYPPWKQIFPVVFIMCKSVLLFNPERKALFKNSLSTVFSVHTPVHRGRGFTGREGLLCSGGTLAHGWFAILWGTESSLAPPLVDKLLLLIKALKNIFQKVVALGSNSAESKNIYCKEGRKCNCKCTKGTNDTEPLETWACFWDRINEFC